MHKRHPMRALMLFAGLAISAIVICPMIGSEWISWKVLFSAGSSMDHEIFLRVPLKMHFEKKRSSGGITSFKLANP